jgi:hypothetical protein
MTGRQIATRVIITVAATTDVATITVVGRAIAMRRRASEPPSLWVRRSIWAS